MTDSFLPMVFDEAIVADALTGDIRYKRGSIPIVQGIQIPSLCFADSLAFFLLPTYSISSTAGEGFLILDCYTCTSAGGLLFAGDPPLGDI